MDLDWIFTLVAAKSNPNPYERLNEKYEIQKTKASVSVLQSWIKYDNNFPDLVTDNRKVNLVMSGPTYSH